MTNGLWIHKIDRCGGPVRIIDTAKRLKASHIIVKSRDGASSYKANRKMLKSLSLTARMSGLDIWLWSWVRAMSPGKGQAYVEDQAMLLAQDAHQAGAKCVVANMESPWSWSRFGGGMLLGEAELRLRAYKYVTTLRDSLHKNCKIGISSFRFPRWHRLPWEEMLQSTEVIGMPQLYFERKGYDEQAQKANQEWRKFDVTDIRISGPGYIWKKGKMDPVSLYNEAKRHCKGVDWWKADGMDEEALSALEGL